MGSPITETTLSAVLAQHPLRGARAVSVIAASNRNDNFLVEDPEGHRFVLRRYRRNPDTRRVAFQLAFQRQLHDLGYPTSQVIENSAGEAMVTDESGIWVLFTYIEGSEFDYGRPGQVIEAGRRLAEFHTVSAQIELEEVLVDANPDARRWWTHGEDELSALDALCAGLGVDEELAYLHRWRAELVAAVSLPTVDALPSGWVHSDFHGRNMVFVGDELRGLFDFDPLYRGRWLEDVAMALVRFAREARGSFNLRPDAARSFLSAYEEVRPLTAGERRLLPLFGPLGWMERASYYLLLRRDGEDWLGHLRLYTATMRAVARALTALDLG